MATRLTASFTLKLDQTLTGPLLKIQGIFDKLKDTLGKLKMDGLARAVPDLQRTENAANGVLRVFDRIITTTGSATAAVRRFGSAAASSMKSAGDRIGVIGGAVSGYSVYGAINRYADFENILRHVAITEKLSGPAAESETQRLMKLIGRDALASGQSSTTVAKAFSDLVLSGIPANEVERLIGIHSKAATAYNISPEALGQAVFALNRNLGIGPENMEGALSSMAMAAKSGKFSVEDFSQFLPMISATFGKLGYKGRPAADAAFAALETVRQNVGESGQAATDLNDLLNYITTPFGQRSFAKIGIDMAGTLRRAEKAGVNPFDALLYSINKHVKGTPIEIATKLGMGVHNMQARDALVALLEHREYLTDLRKLLSGQSSETLNTDFMTAYKAPLVQMRIFQEQIDQLVRRIGQGFVPVLIGLNLALHGVLVAVSWLDEKFPGAGNGILAVVGGLLLLVAALAAMSIVLPAIGAGFLLLAGPVGLVLAGMLALGLAALDVYLYWNDIDAFFKAKFEAIRRWYDQYLAPIIDPLREFLKAHNMLGVDKEQLHAGLAYGNLAAHNPYELMPGGSPQRHLALEHDFQNNGGAYSAIAREVHVHGDTVVVHSAGIQNAPFAAPAPNRGRSIDRH
jgi:TP901 family phage tail tape measure protein